jgi:hypothetical protein
MNTSQIENALKNKQVITLEDVTLSTHVKEIVTAYCKEVGASTYKDVEEIFYYSLRNLIKYYTYKQFEDKNTHQLVDVVEPAIKNRVFRECDSFIKEIAYDAGIREPLFNDPSYKEYLINNRKADPAKFVECIQFLSPMLDFAHIMENCNNSVKAINALWDRILEVESTSKSQSCHFSHAPFGDVGKSTFGKIVKRWAEKHGVKCTEVKIPTDKFVSIEFSRNLICIIEDIQKKDMGYWSNLNVIMDGGTYLIEQKGKDAYPAESRCWLVASSNFPVTDPNSRRVRDSILTYGSTKLDKNNPKHYALSKYREDGEFDIDYYADVFEQMLLSCPKKGFTYNKYEYLTPYAPSAFERAMGTDSENETLDTIAKYYKKSLNKGVIVSPQTLHNRMTYWMNNNITLCEDMPSETPGLKEISAVLIKLNQAKLIKCTTPEKKATYSKNYDVSPLLENLDEILEPKSYELEDDDLILIESETMKAIADAIRSENPTDPDKGPKKEEVKEEVKLPEPKRVEANFDRLTYSDNFTTSPHLNGKDDPYMLNGHFTEDYKKRCVENKEKISRGADNIVPEYFVFECDTKSLEEQRAFINSWDPELVKYIKSITFSGNKSYHVLFAINSPEDITNEEYKTLFGQFMRRNKLDEYADFACGSKSRLTRNPNGIRDNGVEQTCVYCNPDCSVYDLTDELRNLRSNEEFLKSFQQRPIRKPLAECTKTPEEILSGIKKPCRAKDGWDMMQSGNFPSGEDFLSCANGMYSILIRAGLEEYAVVQWIRTYFLEKVAEAHPTNIAPIKAKNWNPRGIRR